LRTGDESIQNLTVAEVHAIEIADRKRYRGSRMLGNMSKNLHVIRFLSRSCAAHEVTRAYAQQPQYREIGCRADSD
jgi:hypothetical protein